MGKAAALVIFTTLQFVAGVITAATGSLNGDPDAGCSCAVFPEDANDREPIIEQSLRYNVSCDEGGAKICQQLCVALAEGARDKASAMICEKLGKRLVNNLKVAVFAKSCDAASISNSNEWRFTGLKSPEPICCYGGEAIVCGSRKD